MANYQEGEIKEIMATTDDLIVKLGQQLVDLINKDKIIGAMAKSNKTLGEARIALAGEVETLKAQAASQEDLEKRMSEIKDDHSRAYSALKTKSRETESKLKEQSREQLASANSLLGQVKEDRVKADQRHSDEQEKMLEKIMKYQLEIQSLKDKQSPSNGSSRVVSSKPKKQGKKYTKKVAKTTASA